MAAMPREDMSEAAAPAMSAAEKLRLFIVIVRLPSWWVAVCAITA
jgi:hypothetical protein